MNKVMRYSIDQAVGFGISPALAEEMECMPLFAVGRPGGSRAPGHAGIPMTRKSCLIPWDRAAFSALVRLTAKAATVSKGRTRQ